MNFQFLFLLLRHHRFHLAAPFRGHHSRSFLFISFNLLPPLLLCLQPSHPWINSAGLVPSLAAPATPAFVWSIQYLHCQTVSAWPYTLTGPLSSTLQTSWPTTARLLWRHDMNILFHFRHHSWHRPFHSACTLHFTPFVHWSFCWQVDARYITFTTSPPRTPTFPPTNYLLPLMQSLSSDPSTMQQRLGLELSLGVTLTSVRTRLSIGLRTSLILILHHILLYQLELPPVLQFLSWQPFLRFF